MYKYIFKSFIYLIYSSLLTFCIPFGAFGQSLSDNMDIFDLFYEDDSIQTTNRFYQISDQQHQFYNPSDKDWFVVYITHFSTFSIKLTDIGPDCDPRIVVYQGYPHPSNTPIIRNDRGRGDDEIYETDLEEGVYYCYIDYAGNLSGEQFEPQRMTYTLNANYSESGDMLDVVMTTAMVDIKPGTNAVCPLNEDSPPYSLYSKVSINIPTTTINITISIKGPEQYGDKQENQYDYVKKWHEINTNGGNILIIQIRLSDPESSGKTLVNANRIPLLQNSTIPEMFVTLQLIDGTYFDEGNKQVWIDDYLDNASRELANAWRWDGEEWFKYEKNLMIKNDTVCFQVSEMTFRPEKGFFEDYYAVAPVLRSSIVDTWTLY